MKNTGGKKRCPENEDKTLARDTRYISLARILEKFLGLFFQWYCAIYLAYPLCRRFTSLEGWGGFSADLDKGGWWESLKVEEGEIESGSIVVQTFLVPAFYTTRQTRGVYVT